MAVQHIATAIHWLAVFTITATISLNKGGFVELIAKQTCLHNFMIFTFFSNHSLTVEDSYSSESPRLLASDTLLSSNAVFLRLQNRFNRWKPISCGPFCLGEGGDVYGNIPRRGSHEPRTKCWLQFPGGEPTRGFRCLGTHPHRTSLLKGLKGRGFSSHWGH
jgi:hypothetical protein